MTAVLKEQNILRLDISKYDSFEVIYWTQTFCSELQAIDYLSFLDICGSFIRSRVALWN